MSLLSESGNSGDGSQEQLARGRAGRAGPGKPLQLALPEVDEELTLVGVTLCSSRR